MVKRDTETQSMVTRVIQEAITWREENVDPDITKATEYYFGRPYGDEREGRSQVVTSEVRDTTQNMLPSLVRVFTASDRVVAYQPKGPEDEALAEQQTDYVNHVFFKDNKGFLALYSVLKDALVRKIGVMKWWWEESTRFEGSVHTGVTDEQIEILRNSPKVDEVVILDSEFVEVEGEEIMVHDVELKRTIDEGRVVVKALPPEEFIFSPNATDPDDATMIGHFQDITVGELRAMGVPEDLIEKHQGSQGSSLDTNEVRDARRIDRGAQAHVDSEGDDSAKTVPYAEVYIQVGRDEEDGVELRRFRCIGTKWEIWEDDIVDHAPFALFMGDPEPHTIVGLSVADWVMPTQRISSHITRGMLDSLVGHLNPSMEVVDTEVNIKDVLNQEIGRVIRTRRPGMIREIPTQFVGGSALPVLAHLKEELAEKTGITQASAGLDPDALQSTTRAGVTATVQSAQQRLELLARVLAETGMTALFRGLLRTIVQHQDRPRTVRMRGEWVDVDPRSWDADLDVEVDVALGTGLVEDKVRFLSIVADKQEEHIQQGSPLVTFVELRETYAEMLELMGHKNTNRFFKAFGPEQQQALEQAQAQSQEGPSPEEILLQIEQMKVQARQAEKTAELDSRQQEKMAELQLKAAELELERLKVMAELGMKQNAQQLDAELKRIDASIRQAESFLNARTQQLADVRTMSEIRVGE